MPKFDIQQQQTVIGARRAAAEDFGAGQGLIQAGKALGQVAGQAANVIIQKQDRDEELSLKRDAAQTKIKFTEWMTSQETLNKTGDGFVEAFEAEWKKHEAEFIEKRSPRFKKKAELEAVNMWGALSITAIQKEAFIKSQFQVSEFQSDLDVISSQVLNGSMEYEDALEAMTGYADAISITPEQRGKLKQNVEDIIGSSAVRGFLQDNLFMEADDLIGQIDNLSPHVRESLKGSVAAKASVHVKQKLRDAAKAFDAGYPVGDLSEQINIASKFNFDQEMGDLQFIQDVQGEVNGLVQLPRKEMEKWINELDMAMLAGEIDPRDIDRINAYRRAYANKYKMLRENPYDWLNRSGYISERIDAIEDITGDFTNQMDQRLAIREQVFKNEGIKIDLFRPEEVAGFLSAINSAPPEGDVALVQNLVSQIQPEDIKYAAAQIGPKDPTLGAAMVNAYYAPAVTRDILLGASRDVPVPDKDKFESEFLRIVGTAIEDDNARGQAMAAVKAVYQERIFRGGETSGTMLPKIYESAVKDVIGPVVKIGKTNTLSFRGKDGAYLDNGDFNDFVDDLEMDAIEATHGDVPRLTNKEPLDLSRVLKYNGRLVSTGDGQYNILDRNGNFAMTRDGRKFELNLKAVYDAGAGLESKSVRLLRQSPLVRGVKND